MFCAVRLKAAIRKIDPGLKISIDPHAGRIGAPWRGPKRSPGRKRHIKTLRTSKQSF
jgi:hypothetical protein